MKYALIGALMVSLSFGLITESFRYQATAGIWEDDYDLLFDPARIPEIEGSRLWTSLSNFVTGTENLFANVSVPYLLIGGKTTFSNFHPGFVCDKTSDKTALPTGLLDPNNNEMLGDGEVVKIDWNDLDNNNIYDQRTVETERRSAYVFTKDKNLYTGFGAKLNNIRAGIGFMRNEYQITNTDPENNFTYSYFEEDLRTNSITFKSRDHFAGDNIHTGTQNEFLLSGWLDRDHYSVGLTGHYGLLSWNNKAVITGASAIHTDPTDTTTYYTATNSLDSLNLPHQGASIGLTAKTFYDYNENAKGKFYLGLFTWSASYGDNAVDYFYNRRAAIYDAFMWDTTTEVTYYSGNSRAKGIMVATKQLFNLSERLKFGFGILFNTSHYFDSTLTRDTIVTVEVYDDNDGITYDPDDYVQRTWSSETWMRRRTGSVNSFEIPVGMEFEISEPLVLRLGAKHTLTIDDFTTVTNLVQYEPERTRIVDGTGTVVEDLIDPDSAPIGSEETGTETRPMTNYYYGVGWQVNENLSIDFMNFSQLTDLNNWCISAKLIFD